MSEPQKQEEVTSNQEPVMVSIELDHLNKMLGVLASLPYKDVAHLLEPFYQVMAKQKRDAK